LERNGSGGVDGLGPNPYAAMSPGGEQLYLSSSRGVARFARDATSGEITFGGVTAPPSGARPERLVVCADGAHVYVLADDLILVYRRTAASGNLAPVEQELLDPQAALDSAADLVLAPDGAHLYVVTGSRGAVTAYVRNAATGELGFVQELFENQGIPIRRVLSVAISPDGAHVYTASDVDDAVAIFTRNSKTGRLTFTTAARNGADGVNGLGGASRVEVSPDGRHVYVGSAGDDALVSFTRDAQSGGLTFLQVIR
jgi:6-phosphogluconolactonase (cycloisomerase 2 family)